QTGRAFSEKLSYAEVTELKLVLNPRRYLKVKLKGPNMLYFSEKFEFAASHKLWNPDLSAEENAELFGKCANPSGHGHNYMVEVEVELQDGWDFSVGRLEEFVKTELIKPLDHKYLNVDVEHFMHTNPTVENLAIYAWDHLAGGIDQARLHCITVSESNRTTCKYYGQ
ncbi:MAG: 6-carboxytetrahydropterin synthase, partial [Planctomycetes bacterium]|nr:6-carboxytetrahydropterin synthase [Planctomycetota bacterium]